MRLLLDESPVGPHGPALLAAGHDVVHIGDVGLLGAPDDDVLVFAVQDQRHLVTVDTDFGALLALSHASVPSVLLLRRGGRSIPACTRQVCSTPSAPQVGHWSGALVVVEH